MRDNDGNTQGREESNSCSRLFNPQNSIVQLIPNRNFVMTRSWGPIRPYEKD